MGCEVYHALKGVLKKRYGIDSVNVGDEGGFAPPIKDVNEPLELLREAIELAGYTGKFKICMDCAASEFYVEDKKSYNLSFKSAEATLKTGPEMVDLYKDWMSKHPIVSIEDPFDQDDWENWTALTAAARECGVQVVGDDLTVTNVERIKTAITKKSCSSLLLKINQIGTITESVAAAKMSYDADWTVMASHRSGETEDSFIADMVVGLGSGQIKSGAPCRGERTCKYNQLLRIEEELGAEAVYGSPQFNKSLK